nr:unnamed protein product [Callosobruchus chinensis]
MIIYLMKAKSTTFSTRIPATDLKTKLSIKSRLKHEPVVDEEKGDNPQRRAIQLIGVPALTCHLQPLSYQRAVGDLSLSTVIQTDSTPPS